MAILTLLTDFGLDDYYVAAVKGVILTADPTVTIVDIAHGLPPGDVECGAFVLASACRHFPPGTVHLAVIDPGVGSGRRILALEGPLGVFVAPDNGLLTPVLDDAAQIRSVERTDLFLDQPSQTFHGRDRFAPICAYLLDGELLEDLGPAIDDPVRLAHRPPRRRGTSAFGRVAHVDRFGNLVTDIPSHWVGDGPLEARVDGRHRAVERAGHYAEMRPGQPAVIPGSLGTLELSLNGDSLARRWQVDRGAPVRLDFG